MTCKFCHGQMTNEDETMCCDYCGATCESGKSGDEWTLPTVEGTLSCGACREKISMDDFGEQGDCGAICIKCLEKIQRKPKFRATNEIFYMRDNRVHSGEVWTVCQVINVHDSWAHTNEQKESWQHFGENGVKYVTAHGVVSEEEAFASKAELLESL